MKNPQLKNEEIGSLCAALSHLLGAGIGTGDALRLLQEDEQDPALGKILEEMARGADDGIPLAELTEGAGRFPSYVCTLVRVGEQSGKTDQTLAALGDYYDRQARMNRRLRAALSYPAMLLGVLLGVIVILLVWVMPVFRAAYGQLGAQMTGVAGFLLDAGQLLGQALPLLCVLAGILLGAAAVKPLRSAAISFAVKGWGDRGVWRRINSARFVQSVALGFGSGMAAQEAVTLASGLAMENNPGFAGRCAGCLEALDRGENIAAALEANRFIGRSDHRLLEAGLRSGKGDQVLQGLARELLERSQEDLEQQMGKIEPAMVAVACAMIGSILLSVMLPLMHIMNAIG